MTLVYRVTADMLFDIEDEAKDFFHDCQLAIVKTTTINPGTALQETSRATLHTCQHGVGTFVQCIETQTITSPTP